MIGLGIMVTAAFLLVVGLIWIKFRSKTKEQSTETQEKKEGGPEPEPVKEPDKKLEEVQEKVKEEVKEKRKEEVKEEIKEKTDREYVRIVERLRKVKKKYKSILFAALDRESLPVTIPVNVAMELAKDKTRCLLIDLDIRRDALAKVFNIEDKPELQLRASRTELENLWVWPAHNFTKIKQMNLRLLVQKAIEKFDLVIINSPYLATSPDRNQIISSARAAIIFSKEPSKEKELTSLIKASECALIDSIQNAKPEPKAVDK